jgi:hypothetical protein
MNSNITFVNWLKPYLEKEASDAPNGSQLNKLDNLFSKKVTTSKQGSLIDNLDKIVEPVQTGSMLQKLDDIIGKK